MPCILGRQASVPQVLLLQIRQLLEFRGVWFAELSRERTAGSVIAFSTTVLATTLSDTLAASANCDLMAAIRLRQFSLSVPFSPICTPRYRVVSLGCSTGMPCTVPCTTDRFRQMYTLFAGCARIPEMLSKTSRSSVALLSSMPVFRKMSVLSANATIFDLVSETAGSRPLRLQSCLIIKARPFMAITKSSGASGQP